MSETLEDKYQYMCELVEDQAREIFEYKKIIAGAQKVEEELEYFVQNIAALIYYQCSLRDQDQWLKRVMDKGIWEPEAIEEEE
tara:strand:+ start:1042 stop:1290 length:249 start_codon:yes stop_codon:yes gene_type:complete